MRRIILAKKAEFRFSTRDALWGLICCKDIFHRDTMRDTIFNRKVLNFNKGVEKMNKELVIGVVLNALRRFAFFYKTMLDRNQRNLLKLKSSKFIPSSDDMKGVTEFGYAKV